MFDSRDESVCLDRPAAADTEPLSGFALSSQVVDALLSIDLLALQSPSLNGASARAALPGLARTGSPNDGSGSFGEDTIVGTAGRDTLLGTEGDDTLDGRGGRDLMVGGLGNDTYLVENVNDRVVEHVGEGLDTILSRVSYTAPAYVERLFLMGEADLSAVGNGRNNLLRGNAGDNTLSGGAGADTLNGGPGADTMFGGLGNDVYYVGSPLDVVTENAGQGLDTVRSYVVYTLPAEVENLTLLGAANLKGTGNGLNNVITGNTGINILSGAAGNDTLLGLEGNDSLYGGLGSDALYGGAGNDYLQVDDGLGDTVDGGAGSDFLQAYFDTSTVALNLTLGSTVAGEMQVTDVEFAQFFLGSAADYLSAGESSALLWSVFCGDGDDTVVGGAQDDGLYGGIYGGNGDDSLVGGAGGDYLFGETGDDRISGGEGDDFLRGGEGHDSIDGGAGDDRLSVNDALSDTIDGGDGFDVLQADYSASTAALNLTLGSTLPGSTQILNIESADIFLGSASDYLSVGSSGTRLGYAYGDSGNDTLVGGDRDDVLYGGIGDDSLLGGAGKDFMHAFWGNDTLIGGAGDDILYLGPVTDNPDSDTLVLDSLIGSDVVHDFASGSDRVMVSASGLPVGDGDSLLEGALARSAPGGFGTKAELVIFTSNLAGGINAAAAAAVIGSADRAYAVGQTTLFVVDNGADSAVYHFHSAGADAVVSASELTLLATLVGTPATAVADYLLGA